MKFKLFVFGLLLIGVCACQDDEGINDDLLIGLWTLESNSIHPEQMWFKQDRTYEHTSHMDLLSPMGKYTEPVVIFGAWSYANNDITFLTTSIRLGDQTVDSDSLWNIIIVEDGAPQGLGGFSPNMPDPALPFPQEPIQTVWTITKVNESSLVVKNGTHTMKYNK